MENNEGLVVQTATHTTENEHRGLRRSSCPSNSSLKSLGKASEQKETGYKLDRNKAIEKKAEACSRGHIKYTLKPGKNFVAEFSTASYEVAKSSMKDILQHNEKINADFCIKFEEGVDQTGAKVEFIYKLFQQKRDGVPGCYSKLTITLYNTTSRLLANGPRVDVMTDIILKDLLNILRVKCRDIEVVDQNIKESNTVALRDPDQLQIHNNNGESHDSINALSLTHEMDEQASSQVIERTVIDEFDNGG